MSSNFSFISLFPLLFFSFFGTERCPHEISFEHRYSHKMCLHVSVIASFINLTETELFLSTASCPSLDLTLEIFNKCRLGQKILPLLSQEEFVLLYSGVSPPDSALTCRKDNTNTRFNMKSSKKTAPGRCKSRAEGQSVPSVSSDSSVNVSERLKGESCSKSFISTSRLSPQHPNSSSSNTETVRCKNHRPRVELKLSKCTLPQDLKNAGDTKSSNTQEKTTVIMSLSSSALSEDFSTCESLQTETLPSHPQAESLTVCEDELERGEECGREKLREDSQG